MKFLLATVLIASLSATAFAQAPAKPVNKKKPVSVKKVPPATQRQAIEEATPLEENDPADKLTAAELEIAKRVYTGEIKCELGAHVKVTPRRRAGYFLVSHGINRFVMHPVESKTGAIRLEDTVRGALWLQLGNKSMLMNQKEGKRLADECASPEQVDFAKNMKPVNLLEPEPAAAAAPAASALPAAAAAVPASAAPAAAVPAAAAPAATATVPAAMAPTAAGPAAVVPAAADAAPAAPVAPVAPAAAAAPAAPVAADPTSTNPAAPAAPAVAAPAAAPAPAQ